MSKVAILVTYVAMSLYGLFKLKTSSIGSFGYAFGFLMYGGGFILWLYILRLYPLSAAFPLAAGSLILGTQLVGHFAIGEQVDVTRLVGVGLILLGIIFLSLSENG